MARSDLPLTPAAFLILFALAGGAKHGYAIMQETRKLSEGGFKMGPATLYTTIQRLLENGWIKEAAAPADSDSRRRYYRLSGDGGSVLNQELSRMEAMVRKAKAMRPRSAESIS